MRITKRIFLIFVILGFASLGGAKQAWQEIAYEGDVTKRHEAAFVEFDGKFYLLGGRRIQVVNIYDPETNTWKEGAKPPIEVHHFQPVVLEDRILIMGAFTGRYPGETGIDRILSYIPATDTWEWGDEIPEERRRGAAGVVVHDDQIYLVCGIINGHIGGHVKWMDRYDPKTSEWTVLADAPHARDHFQAVELGGKIYSGAGRRSSQATKQVFDLVVSEVDVYDVASDSWETIPEPLPTPRAGNMAFALKKSIVFAGGESLQKEAHSEVEAYDTRKGKWYDLPSLSLGRHGTGVIQYKNYLYTCSGCSSRGGGTEMTHMETLKVK